MKIFDFNIHLPSVHVSSVGERVLSETHIDEGGLIMSYLDHKDTVCAYSDCINIMILKGDFSLSSRIFRDMYALAKKDFNEVSITALVDYKRNDVCEYIDMIASEGVKAIKFHSYIQGITENDYPQISSVVEYAAARGLFVCVHTSYGTRHLYQYDNLRLAAFLAQQNEDVPIVLLHSGGSRVLEAMHLVVDSKNVFLETSFSLDYYRGSSLEDDYAFVYKKIGAERVIYGSDYPYVGNSLQYVVDYLGRHGFQDNEMRLILYKNAERVLSGG